MRYVVYCRVCYFFFQLYSRLNIQLLSMAATAYAIFFFNSGSTSNNILKTLQFKNL